MEASAAVAAVFDPVAPPTTFEQTVERLGNSRSTLRNALTTLVQSGHLVSVRGRSGGTFVVESPPLSAGTAKPSATAIREVLDGRVAVETGAVVLAVERARTSDLERMERLVERMAGARRFDAYRRADTRFHIALAE